MQCDCPVFKTDRLRVFEVEIDPRFKATNAILQVYLGFDSEGAISFPVITATVCEALEVVENAVPVQYIETAALHRGKGFATEMWAGLKKHYGRALKGRPVTKAGCEFLKKLGDSPPDVDCSDFE